MTSQKLDCMTDVFEQVRPRLRGVAYRMLGSVADAEDAVQDVYLKWQKADLDKIKNPEAWLVTVCTRLCIDMLRSAHKARVDYVGPWLPEPVLGDTALDGRDQAELASSLTTAFLLLLERLGPVERAAYLLREVFDYAYKDVAFALGKNEAACRQLVLRAKKRLKKLDRLELPSKSVHEELLTEFMTALRSGDLQRLERVLAEDVEFVADGGGVVPAAKKVVASRAEVAKVMLGVWKRFWLDYDIKPTTVNGGAGAILTDNGELSGVLSLAVNGEGKCTGVHIVRNPEKLTHISRPVSG